MFRRTLCLIAAASCLDCSTASANFFFTDQPGVATGKFEWDFFDLLGAVGFPGPHAPDIGASGVGSAAITATTAGMGFPGPAVTSSNNLYAGARTGKYTVGLTGAATTGVETTAVMQITAIGTINPASLLLNGAVPNEFVDRGLGAGANYYWAEWRFGANAAFNVTFDGGHPHFSLAGAQLEYFNVASVFDAVTPPPIPEPSTVSLASAALAAAAALKRRRRISFTPRAGTEGR